MNVEFNMNFESGNAAFADDPHREVGSILESVADNILAGEEVGTVRDSNGNKVGQWYLDVDEGKPIAEFINENREELEELIKAACPNGPELDDEEIETWIMNDEILYSWAQREDVHI